MTSPPSLPTTVHGCPPARNEGPAFSPVNFCPSLPLSPRILVAPNAFSHFGPLCFQQLAHSSAISWGWGAGASVFGFPISSFLLQSSLSPFLSHSYKLLRLPANRNSFLFKQFRTPSQKHPGWGTPCPRAPYPTPAFLVVVP